MTSPMGAGSNSAIPENCQLCLKTDLKISAHPTSCQRIVIECSANFCLECLSRLLNTASKASPNCVKCVPTPVPSGLALESMAVSLAEGNKSVSLSQSVWQLPVPEAILPNCPTDVIISHVVSPDQFFVQTRSNEEACLALASSLRTCDYLPNFEELRRKPMKDEFVVAQYDLDQQWYRGRVIRLTDKSLYEVFFVDYGNWEEVPLNHLKPLGSELQSQPMLAIECALAHVVQGERDKWTEEARNVMNHYFGNTNLTYSLTVVSTPNIKGVLEVELFLPASKFVQGDTATPAQDILAFYGVAKSTASPLSAPSSQPSLPGANYQQNCSYPVSISFWLSPSEFFVQEKDTIVLKVQEELQAFMSQHQEHLLMGPVFVGMLAVAEFQADGQVYRCRVSKIAQSNPEEKPKIWVNFFDFGNTDQVSPFVLRKLPDKFLQYPPQCLNCCLDVESRPSQWPNEVSKRVFDIASAKPLEMLIKTVRPSEQALVEVKFVDGSTALSQNALQEMKQYLPRLLRSKRRSETGSNSSSSVKSQSILDCERDQAKDSAHRIAPKKVAKKREYLLANNRLGLVVSHVKSPDAIFVRLQDSDDDWFAFHDKIKKVLSSSQKYGRHTIAVGDTVGFRDRGHYFRALVKFIENETQFHLFLVDIGERRVSTLDQLAPLELELKKTSAFCFRIKLAGLQPLGTSDGSWSATANDEIRAFLKSKMNVTGEIMSRGAHVENDQEANYVLMKLTYSTVFIESAFGETKSKDISVEEHLIEKGFALRRQDGLKLAADASQVEKVGPKCSGLTFQPNTEIGCQSPPCEEERDAKDGKGRKCALDSFKWPPPVMVTEKDFDGTVTYLDMEGQIYLQTHQQMRLALGLSDTLEAFVRGRETMHTKSKDHSWIPGEIGISEYPQSDIVPGWFRFQLIQWNPDSRMGQALFVDYGETKEIDMSRALPDYPPEALTVPILALRCKLAKVVPKNGCYDVAFLDEVHSMIVEKPVSVHIDGESIPKLFPIPVVLTLNNAQDSTTGIDLARLFIDRGAVRLTESMDEWNGPETEERQEIVALGIQPVAG